MNQAVRVRQLFMLFLLAGAHWVPGLLWAEPPAFDAARHAAEAGNPQGQYTLGAMYDWGAGTPKNLKKARYWYEKAAAQGEVEAEFRLGSLYFIGRGVKKNDGKVLYWYQKAAEQGFPKAEFSLGWLYENGKCAPKDPEKALPWFEKAAAHGFEGAQAHVEVIRAELQRRGIVLPAQPKPEPAPQTEAPQADSPQTETPFALYEKAALDGEAKAQYQLCTSYQLGKTAQSDIDKAIDWCEKSATQGYLPAQVLLPSLYENTHNVLDREVKQLFWYQKAADQGNLQGIRAMARTAQQSGQHLRALYWYQKAAALCDAESQFELAGIYEYGRGVPQDFKQAVSWYEKGAEQGYVASMNGLAQLYRQGVSGVPRNMEKSIAWAQKAVDQGDWSAAYGLANVYLNGDGVPQDEAKAASLFLQAAEHGDYLSTLSLAVLYEKGRGVSPEPLKAYAWLSVFSATSTLDTKADLKRLADKLTPVQLTEATALASVLQQKIHRAALETESRQAALDAERAETEVGER